MTNYEREVVKAQKQLYAYAMYLTHNPDRANDLLQNTSLRILTNAHNYTEQNSFKAWAKVIMLHTFYNNEHITDSSTRPIIVGYDDVDDSYSVVAEGHEEYKSYEILALINSLPQEQALLLRRRVEGYKYEEIAEEFDIPVGTVKSALFTAKKRLKRLLEQ